MTSSWQGAHHTLKCNQRQAIRRKAPQETGQKTSPVSLEAVFPPDCSRRISPMLEMLIFPKRISHDALFHHVRRVRGKPEDLCGQAAGPEVDRRR